MFKRNDGIGVNATQNKFTAMLKRSIHNSKINYLKSHNKILCNEIPLEDYAYLVGEEYDYVQAIIDYDTVRAALKILSDRERKIIVLHILEDKDFAEIGRQFGLSYHGTATIFHRALKKLRETLGRYRDEF